MYTEQKVMHIVVHFTIAFNNRTFMKSLITDIVENKTDHISHQTNRFLQGGKLSSLRELLKPDGWQIFLWYFSKIGNKLDMCNFCLLWDVLQPPFLTTITCAWILEYCWSNVRQIWESTLSKSDYLVGHRGRTWEWIFKDFFLHFSRWTCQTFCNRCIFVSVLSFRYVECPVT